MYVLPGLDESEDEEIQQPPVRSMPPPPATPSRGNNKLLMARLLYSPVYTSLASFCMDMIDGKP